MRIGHLNDKEVEVRVPWQVAGERGYRLTAYVALPAALVS